jgi:tetratricopeptide (TPR) repeat protein
MLLPFVIVHIMQSYQSYRNQSHYSVSQHETRWIIAYLCFIAAGITLLFAALMFSASVRAVDERYWWVYPGSMVVSGILAYSLLNQSSTPNHRTYTFTWSVFGIIGFVLAVGIIFVFNQLSGVQYIQYDNNGGHWPLFMIASVIFGAIGAAIASTTPILTEISRRWFVFRGIGMSFYALGMILTILYTQSRGPWIGGIIGVLALSTLIVISLRRHDQRRQHARASVWTRVLAVKGLLVILGVAALLIFNLSDHPTIVAWRELPYIGRMGRLLEVDQATGLVRWLIWVGDEHADGAIGLIRADPVRTIIGWGPETMFVTYSQHYPPSLANIEARGASPDRAHQMLLDELITRGLLGFASLILVVGAALRHGWRTIDGATTHQTRFLAAAALSAIVAHGVEGLSGIPIVATLLLFWVAIALIVVLPRLVTSPADAPTPSVPPAVAPRPSAKRMRRQSRASIEHAPPVAVTSRPLPVLVGYAAIVIGAMALSWHVNIAPMIADTVYQRAQSIIDRPSATAAQLIDGTSQLVTAISLDPYQDFYYLSFGRGLLAISAQQIARDGIGVPSTQPINIDDVVHMTPFGLRTFLSQHHAIDLLELAHMSLDRARQLSPLNKDHYANLGRLYVFWRQHDNQNQQLLPQAESWYRRGADIAPYDVTILNEWAGVLLTMNRIDEADSILQRSMTLDPRYLDTAVRRAELTRLRGDVDASIDQYLAVLARDPHALDAHIIALARSLGTAHPEALLRLRDGYVAVLTQTPDDIRIHAIIGLLSDRAGDRERAAAAFRAIIARQPANLEARRNLTIVLSGMLRYEEAYSEAQQMLTLATPDRVNATERDALGRLVDWLDARRSATP